MPREHGESGEFVETVTLDDVLGVFDTVRGPVVLSADVADELGCSRETARRKLEQLHDRGDLDRRKVARRVVYWRPDQDADERARERSVRPSEDTDAATDTDTDVSAHTPRERVETPSLDAVDFPDSRDREDCLAAVGAARAYLREHGTATMRDLVMNVMPAHPVGYNVDDAREKLAAGDRYRGGWWRLVVRPGLEALDDVAKPPRGGSDWEYVGDGQNSDTDDDPLDESGPYDPTAEFDS